MIWNVFMILDSVAILLTGLDLTSRTVGSRLQYLMQHHQHWQWPLSSGSILGQLLFLLYQNNLSNSINHSKIATFADDTKIYKVINKHTYKLQDSALKTTDYERDLGVWTSSTLTWSKQVLHQCAQANRSLGYIRRSTIKIKTISVRRMLYLTLVRSHLAYASQV